ncbi:MAG: DUF2959 domain-containing protein [Gammaproteobacteria bacterium]|nr:DUF2959 domain-containing protein [Gammaproteobacteria bacterium]
MHKMTQASAIFQGRHNFSGLLRTLFVLMLALGFSGCTTVKYSALEKVGIHKRDILVDRVEDARDAQQETRNTLVSAYSELSSLIGYDGGDLEDKYQELSRAVSRSEEATEELDERLESIDRVSADLFDEWQAELAQYNSAKLRADQTTKLELARRRYADLRNRMRTARERVDPVMLVLRDNVLFLKHSLNARALAALRDQESVLQTQVDTLIRDMQRAIDEANAFIANMQAG